MRKACRSWWRDLTPRQHAQLPAWTNPPPPPRAVSAPPSLRISVDFILSSIKRKCDNYNQWRRNEFESWGHRSGANVGDTDPARAPEKIFFGRVPPHFGFKSTISHFWWALSWWSVQFGQFHVCCSSTHGAPRAQLFVKKVKSNYFIVRPKVDLLSLPHLGNFCRTATFTTSAFTSSAFTRGRHRCSTVPHF